MQGAECRMRLPPLTKTCGKMCKEVQVFNKIPKFRVSPFTKRKISGTITRYYVHNLIVYFLTKI